MISISGDDCEIVIHKYIRSDLCDIIFQEFPFASSRHMAIALICGMFILRFRKRGKKSQ